MKSTMMVKAQRATTTGYDNDDNNKVGDNDDKDNDDDNDEDDDAEWRQETILVSTNIKRWEGGLV